MKKGKLLILLLAVLSLAVLFVACDQTQTEAPSETGTQSETVVENNEEQTIGEIATEQETVKHEIHDYFDLVDKVEDPIFTEISRLDGNIVSEDIRYNLVAISTKDLDNQNIVTETVTVYDLLTGETILTQSVSNAYMADDEDFVELSVTIDYPIIRVSYTSCEEEDGNLEYSYEVSYYQSKKDGECIYTTTDDSYEYEVLDNGLSRIVMGDKTFWIDGDGDVVRSIETIVAGGYDQVNVNSEYKGYIYSWNNKELLIFNRSGIVSGRYLAGSDATISVNVLNNGNALIQEFTEVTVYDSYDFALNGTRYVMKSYVMNFITGEATEIDLNMVISSVITKYEQDANDERMFILTKGSENYGYVYRVANGSIAVNAELCVLDNDVNILYTLKNDTFGLALEMGVIPLNDNVYMAVVNTNGYEHFEMFDLEGNSISQSLSMVGTAFDASLTDKYIVTDNVIYDYGMNPVYSIIENGYYLIGVENENIYLGKRNFATGAVETYVITPESKTPELFIDDRTYDLDDVGYGYYVLYDVEQDVYRLYNIEGVELLVSHESLYVSIASEEIVLVSTTFNGEDVIYVIK